MFFMLLYFEGCQCFKNIHIPGDSLFLPLPPPTYRGCSQSVTSVGQESVSSRVGNFPQGVGMVVGMCGEGGGEGEVPRSTPTKAKKK